MNKQKKLGVKVKITREESGLSQDQLSELAQIHRTYLSGIENGSRNPTLDVLIRLSDALKITLSDLMENI
jgi:transcriptional regulator with XRE-family HTH domain